MQFIVRIGQSRFAPYAISCNEDEGENATEILKILRQRAQAEFLPLIREIDVSVSLIVSAVGDIVHDSISSRQGSSQTFQISGGELKPTAAPIGIHNIDSSDYFLEIIVLDDAAVAERDAFVDEICGVEPRRLRRSS